MIAGGRYQAMAVQHGMHGAGGRHLDGVRQAPQQALADLASAPVRLFTLGGHNRRFHLLGQLVGVAEGPAGAVAQPLQSTLLIPFKDLIPGLARDPKLPAQRGHALAGTVEIDSM